MAIERDLIELLHDHDCVIVPQWGGFLTHYRPARLDEARHLIHPPGKELGFNRHLVRNDGLLADHIAKRANIDFSAATLRIEEEVALWQGSFADQGRFELPHMGIFYRDAEGNLQFDPDKRGNFMRDAYGLRPLKALPVKDELALPVLPVIPFTPKPQREPVPGPQRRSVRWAAAAFAAVILGAAAFWSLYNRGNGGAQWSDISPWRTGVSPTYVLPDAPLPDPVVNAGLFTLPEGTDEVVTVPLTPGDSVTVTVDMRPSAPVALAVADTTSVAMPKAEGTLLKARFHVIGGCFAQPENADKRLAELQVAGYPAVRLARRGQLYPVAFASYASRAEALDALAAIRQRGDGGAWLLVR
jgi:hypothetical protein